MSFNRRLGMRVVESPDGGPRTIELDPTAEHEVGAGTVHFAVLATLAEVAAADAAGPGVVPTQLSLQFLRRAASDRLLRAHGKVLKAGRGLVFAEGEVFQDDQIVAKAAVTFARVP